MNVFNKEKQIEYWKITALSDMELAELIINNGKILHGLFCCHLTTEKALKAHFVRNNSTFAPKTHNLTYLAEKSGLEFTQEHIQLMTELMQYQLERRYPEYTLESPSPQYAYTILTRTQGFLKWLIEKL